MAPLPVPVRSGKFGEISKRESAFVEISRIRHRAVWHHGNPDAYIRVADRILPEMHDLSDCFAPVFRLNLQKAGNISLTR